MTVTRLVGQVLDHVRALPDRSVDFVASSPPFLALRNYNDVEGQWGSERDPAAFLDHQLELAAELRRVLTDHGSIAIELGDTYSGSGGSGGDYHPGGLREGQIGFAGSEAARRRGAEHWRAKAESRSNWPPAKSLCGVPTLYAWSLAYGRNLLNPAHELEPWRVRNVIVWARNNPPVGALGDKYRPATSYITVATPSGKRWFDLDAVRSDHKHGSATARGTYSKGTTGGRNGGGDDAHGDILRDIDLNPAGAPPLDHWTDEYDGDTTWLINTAGSSLAHYAMWPARLAERLILSMCPAEVCRTCAEPRRRIVDIASHGEWRRPELNGTGSNHGGTGAHGHRTRQANTLGWSDCGHGNYRPGVVLDPFAGTGTTLAVADIHGRDAIGIDLDPDNHGLYERRYAEVWRALKPDAGVSPVTEHGTQLGLL